MIRLQASFDDGTVFDMNTAEILKSHNIKATFFIPVNWQKYNKRRNVEPLSENEVKLIAQSHYIGSHGVNHALLTRVSEEEAFYEIFNSKIFWDKKYRVRAFCYPRGYYTSEIIDMVKQAGYRWARTTKVGELLPTSNPLETHTTVHIGLDRKEYGMSWLDYSIKMIEKAKTMDRAIYHFWGHSEEIDRMKQWDNFDIFLRELKNAGLCS